VNYDWDVPGGRLIVNPRAMKKTALVGPDATPATWVSKFGSVTLNQYGREFPIGGINQVGLAMQVLWLEETEYPTEATGPEISALQWVQYSLDNLVTAKEVADSAGRFKISSPAKIHFLACDRSRSCAVIEFLDGKPKVRAGRELPLPVLTNSTYADSIKALNATLGYGGLVIKETDTDDESLRRFVEAAQARNRLEIKDLEHAVNGAFDILADVALGEINQWRVVYDLRWPAVHFTTRGNANRRSIYLTAVDFHCLEAGVVALDLESKGEGDQSALLAPYSTQNNLDLVRSSIGRTGFLGEMKENQILNLGQYPETLQCTSGPRPPTPKASGPLGPPQIAVE
jgi:choloylglycine hydrolase